MTMRAAVVGGPGKLQLQQVPLPEPEPGFARVRMLACGICGTDLHFRHAGLWPEGHVPGHEIFGEVDVVGDGVTRVATGDRVAVEPLLACGSCAMCQAGRGNVCPQVQLYGIALPGGFADALCVPEGRLFPVGAEVPAEIAALAEPVAVAVHGVRRGHLEAGQRVLVLGAGTIGLLSVLAARAAGAGEVWISARHPHQAELARALGASRVLEEAEATPESLALLGMEAPIDLVVETVGGSADTLRAASLAMRHGGTVSVVGVFLGDVALPAMPLLLKEGTVTWSNCYQHTGSDSDFADAVALLTAERDALAAMTTHTVALDEIDRGFELASDKAAGAVKVTVRGRVNRDAPGSFDRVAKIYDATRGLPPGAEAEMADALAALLANASAAPRVLEVGVGTGRIALPLAARGCRMVGVDIASAMLAELSRKGRIALVMASAPALPFGRSFDAALFVHVLHLVPDPAAVLRATIACLRPGATLVNGGEASPDDSLPAQAIRLVHSVTDELCGLDVGKHGRHVRAVQALDAELTAAGATRESHVLTSWEEPFRARDLLAQLEGRMMSWMWRIPEERHADVVREAETRLEALCDGLDRVHPYPRAMNALVARLPA